MKLGDSSKVQLLDEIIIIGSPRGLQGTVSKGIVSAKRKNFKEFEEVIQTSAPISLGSSGSPVLLKETHEVIGVAVMVYKRGQNLNFFIPINKLKDLMSTNKEKMDDLVKNLGKQVWEKAKNGDKNAQAFLGISFYYGINWNKDYKKAMYWLSFSFIKIDNVKNKKKIEELWSDAMLKLTESQADLVLPRVDDVLQGKYPIISQDTVFISSPPCTSPIMQDKRIELGKLSSKKLLPHNT